MIVFNNISLKRGQTELFENATATINPKQKVGLVGKNGCGKSSLLALLKKELTPEGGEVTYPSNWRVSWVNQETPALDIPAIDYVIQGDREYYRLQQELNEANERNDGHAIARIHGQLETLDAWTIQSRAASLLHGLGFNQEEIAQPVKSFSGGWRMRLNLAQALLCPSDLLLLDEPTNHLDLDMRQALTEALVDYEGSLVVVSHDRHLLRNTVEEFYLVHDKKVEEFKGDLEDYQKWLSEQNSISENKVSEKVGDNENSVQNRKEQKRREAELRQQTAPLRKKITQLEEKMNKFSSELANIENQLADTKLYNAENKEKLTALLAQQVDVKKALDDVETEWMTAQEELEEMLQA